MGSTIREHRYGQIALTASAVSVAANTTAEQTFTVVGLKVGDYVDVTKPSHQAGLGVLQARVSAADTIAIQFINNTASPIVPTASSVYIVFWFRPEVAGVLTAVD